MNELKIFENEEFGNLRTMEIDGKNLFYCKRCCRSFGV